MPKLRPPSYVKRISLPVFGIDWYGEPNNSSIVAYCGGGGSAKTGVHNKIMLHVSTPDSPANDATHQDSNPERIIETGDQVCVSVKIYRQYSSNTTTDCHLWLLAAIGDEVVRYSLPDGIEESRFFVGGGCNALAVNAMGDIMAVGCEDTVLHLFQMATTTHPWTKLAEYRGHEKAICSVHFAPRSLQLISSAKDGTCRVWTYETSSPNAEGSPKLSLPCRAVLTCDINTNVPTKNSKPSNRPVQVLVRGCAFGDLEGNIIYTVASGRKGTAFLTRWINSNNNNVKEYQVNVRTPIHPCPISAMALSADGGLLALGGVDGTILLFDVGAWKVLRQFSELHELPVTCIAARPYSTPLPGDGLVPLHAISASADSQMGMLTLVTKVPRTSTTKGSAGKRFQILPSTPMMLFYSLIMYLIHIIIKDTLELCSDNLTLQCLHHTVLVAPPNHPAILFPPH
jgi:WD40 repeat protein